MNDGAWVLLAAATVLLTPFVLTGGLFLYLTWCDKTKGTKK